MKNDTLRRYIDLRSSLVREKAELEKRLQQINDALGHAGDLPPSPASASESASVIQTPAASIGGGSRRGRRKGGKLSLREAVLQATAGGPKTKQEILDAVKDLGYKFNTKNPANSLGVILYGKNPRFNNENGRFSVAEGSSRGSAAGGKKSASRSNGSASASSGESRGGAFGRKKRNLSPEARERIAAAQRARWAKAKS